MWPQLELARRVCVVSALSSVGARLGVGWNGPGRRSSPAAGSDAPHARTDYSVFWLLRVVWVIRSRPQAESPPPGLRDGVCSWSRLIVKQFPILSLPLF